MRSALLLLRACLKTHATRRVRARGLQAWTEKPAVCRPGALTGRVFKQANLLVGLSGPTWAAMINVSPTSAWVGTYFAVTLNAVDWRDNSEAGQGQLKGLAAADPSNYSGEYIFPDLSNLSGLVEVETVTDGAVRTKTLYADGAARQVTLIATSPTDGTFENATIFVVDLDLTSDAPTPLLIGTTVNFTARLAPLGSLATQPSGGISWVPDLVASGTALTTASSWGSAAADAGDKNVWVASNSGNAFSILHLTVYALVELTFESGSDFMEVSMPFSIKAHFYPIGLPAGQPIWSLSPATGSALTSPADGLETVTLSPDKPGQYTLTATCGTSSKTITNIAYRIEWDRTAGKHASLEPSSYVSPILGALNLLTYTLALDEISATANGTGGSVVLTPPIAGNPTTWDGTTNQFRGPSLLLEIEFQTRGSDVARAFSDNAQPSGESHYSAYLNLGGASCDIEVSISAAMDAWIDSGGAVNGTAPYIFYGDAWALIEGVLDASNGKIIQDMEFRVTEPYIFKQKGLNPSTFNLSAVGRQKLCTASANIKGVDGAATLATWRATCQPTISVHKRN